MPAWCVRYAMLLLVYSLFMDILWKFTKKIMKIQEKHSKYAWFLCFAHFIGPMMSSGGWIPEKVGEWKWWWYEEKRNEMVYKEILASRRTCTFVTMETRTLHKQKKTIFQWTVEIQVQISVKEFFFSAPLSVIEIIVLGITYGMCLCCCLLLIVARKKIDTIEIWLMDFSLLCYYGGIWEPVPKKWELFTLLIPVILV